MSLSSTGEGSDSAATGDVPQLQRSASPSAQEQGLVSDVAVIDTVHTADALRSNEVNNDLATARPHKATTARSRPTPDSRRASSISSSGDSEESTAGFMQSARTDPVAFPFQRVFVRYNNFYYSATLTSIEGGQFIATFDDHSYAEISQKEVRKQLLKCQLSEGDIVTRSENIASGKKQPLRYEVIRVEDSVTRSTKSPTSFLDRNDAVVVRGSSAGSKKKGKAREEVWKVEATVLISSKEPFGRRGIGRDEYGLFAKLLEDAAESDAERTVSARPATAAARGLRSSSASAVAPGIFSNYGFIFTSTDESTEAIERAKASARAGQARLIDDPDALFKTTQGDSESQTSSVMVVDAQPELLSLKTVMLVAKMPLLTPKYLKALAIGIPCVSHVWIRDCVASGHALPWEPYCCESAVSESRTGGRQTRKLKFRLLVLRYSGQWLLTPAPKPCPRAPRVHTERGKLRCRIYRGPPT